MKQKILIIDDEVNIAETIGDLLEIQGYDVKVAFDGEAGFFSAINEVPDLILCDVMMPKMNGYDVLEAIRKYHKTRQVPFVFLTAKGCPKDFRDGMNLGADDYLLKPIENRELSEVIKKRLVKYRDLVDIGLEEEKKRVSQDLHDTLQQTLLGLKMKLDYLNETRPTTEIGDCLSLTKTAISQMRLIIDGRMDDPLAGTVFNDRLVMMVDKLQGYVRFNLKVSDEWESILPAEKSGDLFKVLYEVFNNEIKHSDAKNVTLRLTENATDFVIDIKDDGIGINPSNFREGRGFKNMRERMGTIGGEIVFDTKGPGLSIKIVIRK